MEESDAHIFHQFAESFYRNRRRYCNFTQRFVHNQTDAEQIVDNCFLRFWERREQIDRKKLEPYFYAALRNNSLEWLRTRLRQQEIRKEIGDRSYRLRQYDIASLDAFDSDSIFTTEIRELTLRELKRLPERTRCIFMDSRFNCLDHEQIAQKYGIPKFKVKREIGIVLQNLRRVLKDYLPLSLITTLLFFTAY